MRKWILLIPVLSVLIAGCAPAGHAPVGEGGDVHFAARFPGAESVALAGDFNGWDASAQPMKRGDDGLWHATIGVPVGYHEYKYVVDGKWVPDPKNPATVTNNYGEPNSVFYFDSLGKVQLKAPKSGADALIEKPAGEGKVYLAIVWHQHQPFYLDASKDQLIAPWVRTHTTKDYYDMTAMVAQYPDIHVTVNLTPVLLYQIENYYVRRLGPYYDPQTNRIRSDAFLKKWKGHTDPWVDLMLTPTSSFGPKQDAYLFRNEWSAFSVSHVIMGRFPEYAALRDKPRDQFTTDDRRDLKCFFYLANFDPDFLRGPVKLVTGRTVDLSDLVSEGDGPVWTVGRHFTEDDANRLVAESFKIAEAIIPLHREMKYDPVTQKGQVEVTTTPFFHPILPLLIDVHAGRSETDQAPKNLIFRHPEDAALQVGWAADAYGKWFGGRTHGMWPAEGSVSEAAVDQFARAGVEWIATGDGVLKRSLPEGMVADRPYEATGPNGGRVAVFFRNTHLSDLVGFRYQRWDPEEAAEDLVRQILTLAPEKKGESNLVTVLLDGENAWEWYERDPDGKQFLHALYRKLGEMQKQGRIVTVTPSEYLHGNPGRNVPAHPMETLDRVKELWPGSWIHADFATWIGEPEENRAWEWLAKVRTDLGDIAGQYRPLGDHSDARAQAVARAWWSMLAAEGSDWFWWYGDDQNTGEGDTRWDKLYRAHLTQVYRNLRDGGYQVEVPDIPSLMDADQGQTRGGGAMAPGQ